MEEKMDLPCGRGVAGYPFSQETANNDKFAKSLRVIVSLRFLFQSPDGADAKARPLALALRNGNRGSIDGDSC
jgi:hypothetical protein